MDRELELRWKTSSHSAGNGMCVEVATIPAHVAVRDSKAPDFGMLWFPRTQFDLFLAAAKRDEFDQLP